jgi:hypothetical protein
MMCCWAPPSGNAGYVSRKEPLMKNNSRRARAIAIARAEDRKQLLIFRLTLIAAGAFATLCALLLA